MTTSIKFWEAYKIENAWTDEEKISSTPLVITGGAVDFLVYGISRQNIEDVAPGTAKRMSFYGKDYMIKGV